MTTIARLSFLETQFAAEDSAEQEEKLRSLEATLFGARADADSIDEPVLVYFIDMAIAELRRVATFDEETPTTQDGRKSNDKSNVIEFANSPETVA
jgi:hypothetical protein